MQTTNTPQVIDLPRLRGVLAARRIPHKTLAKAAGLSQHHTYRILAGSLHPGELARIKLAAGMARLGLDKEADYAAAS